MKLPSVDVAKSFMADVPKANAFLLWNGNKLMNLEELESALDYMPSEIFSSHVTDSKNDFSNWVLHVIKDDYLAELLSKENSRERMISVLKRRIMDLKEIINREEKRTKTIKPFKKKHTETKKTKKVSVLPTKKKEKKKEKLPPPKEKEYLRHESEHIHFCIKQFLWGFVLGIILSAIVFIWF